MEFVFTFSYNNLRFLSSPRAEEDYVTSSKPSATEGKINGSSQGAFSKVNNLLSTFVGLDFFIQSAHILEPCSSEITLNRSSAWLDFSVHRTELLLCSEKLDRTTSIQSPSNEKRELLWGEFQLPIWSLCEIGVLTAFKNKGMASLNALSQLSQLLLFSFLRKMLNFLNVEEVGRIIPRQTGEVKYTASQEISRAYGHAAHVMELKWCLHSDVLFKVQMESVSSKQTLIYLHPLVHSGRQAMWSSSSSTQCFGLHGPSACPALI